MGIIHSKQTQAILDIASDEGYLTPDEMTNLVHVGVSIRVRILTISGYWEGPIEDASEVLLALVRGKVPVYAKIQCDPIAWQSLSAMRERLAGRELYQKYFGYLKRPGDSSDD